jgi:hypothetical protein
MAAKAGVRFHRPEMVVNDPEKRTVVVCVEASMGEATEWSFGEVSPANNKNAYPYAMAEKRAKDRVALKLLGMSGLVYSEEEADDFRNSRPAAPATGNDNASQEPPQAEPPAKSSAQLKRDNAWDILKTDLEQDMVDVRTLVALERVKVIYRKRATEEGWNAAFKSALKNEFDTYEDRIKAYCETVKDIEDTFPGARIVDERIRQHPLMAGE